MLTVVNDLALVEVSEGVAHYAMLENFAAQACERNRSSVYSVLTRAVPKDVSDIFMSPIV